MKVEEQARKHPLERFGYCPVCGSSHFVVNNEKSKRCETCGFIYYANPSSATAAFIFRPDGCLLVARRGKEPAKGTLDLVGGFVDMYESSEEGMLREIAEETGLHLDKATYLFSLPNLYQYSGMTIHTLDMFYRCEVGADVQPKANDDAAELLWLPLDQVKPEQFGLMSIRQGVSRYLTEMVGLY